MLGMSHYKLRRPVSLIICLSAITSALLIAILAATSSALGFLVPIALVVIISVYRRPYRAAYIYTSVTPLIVGINRGSVLPGVRINEVVLVLLLAVVASRMYVDSALARGRPIVLTTLDRSVIALILAGSVIPAAIMLARGLIPNSDDLSYGLILPKLGAVYSLFRLSASSNSVVHRILLLCVASNGVSAVLGLLQTAGFPPVITILGPYSDPNVASFLKVRHATSTFGSSLSFADVMTVSSVICLVWFFAGRTHKAPAMAATAVFAVSALASGEFSGVIGLVTVLTIAATALRRRLQLISGVLVSLIFVIPALAPVLGARLSDIDPATGLPAGWTGSAGRINNIVVYILPHFAQPLDILFGVRLSAQVQSPYPWATWLYIESGYIWVLWVGGVPLLLATIAFISVGVRTGFKLLCSGPMTRPLSLVEATLGVATLAAFGQVAVLMFVDPHLTYRGSGDLLFELAGLTSGVIFKRCSNDQYFNESVGFGRLPARLSGDTNERSG